MKVWDLETGDEHLSLEGHPGGVLTVCSVENGGRTYLASAGADSLVKVWDLETGDEHLSLEGHTDGVRGVCSVENGGRTYLASAGDDRTVKLWDLDLHTVLLDMNTPSAAHAVAATGTTLGIGLATGVLTLTVAPDRSPAR